ncbi:hypothetical protein AB0D66_26725 [Streptomyces sp. NPDC048270]|uniref:hypothetical protein n=1 Tax=Streptomyces sp. NPDC048270 TaxID=3154615 RepID=UPI0033D8656B
MYKNQPLVMSVAIGVAIVVAAVAAVVGAPWWLYVLVLLCLLAAIAVVAVQAVFPQESEHRLGWWKDSRRYRLRRLAVRQGAAGTGRARGDE